MFNNWWMMKNSRNAKDAMLTFAFLGFLVVVVKFVLSNVTLIVGESFNLSFGALDATLVASVLTPTLGSYVMRRWTTAKLENNQPNNNDVQE